MQPRDMTIVSDCFKGSKRTKKLNIIFARFNLFFDSSMFFDPSSTYLFSQTPPTIEQNIGQYAPNKKQPLFKENFEIHLLIL